MIRKTSLLRIVPTACGQAADICTEPIRIGVAMSPRRDFHRGQLDRVQCSEIAYRSRRYIAIEFSERSYLFTISDITHPHQAIGLVTGAELFFRRTSRASNFSVPAGGARRDRTDDLLLAKQALSQLSYGPSREQGSEVSNQRASAFFLIANT